MIEALDEHENMRRRPDGQACSRSQRSILSSAFQQHWAITPAQYTCVCDLLDEGALRNMRAAREAAIPVTPLHVSPAYVRRCFASHQRDCCGRMMRVRKIQATLYGRGICESVWSMVKDCRHCKAVYYCDKRVIRGNINNPPTSAERTRRRPT